tara:strand:- start:369 stop:686 length:318 start_codon:yes stop_codon:yes gene_type:complete
MVKKSTLALIGIGLVGISLLAARPKVITRTEPEPIPIPVPEPVIIPQFLETPLNLDNALNRVKQEFGEIFTRTTERVRKQRQITLGAERYKMINYFENVTKEVKL